MAVNLEDVEIGKSYQLANGTVRKVYEIVPDSASAHVRENISKADIIRYEATKWAYDASRDGGRSRVKVKVREKLNRADFAKEVLRRID